MSGGYYTSAFTTLTAIQSRKCEAVYECGEMYSVMLIDEIETFKGTQEMHKQLYHMGQNYILSLWVKADFTPFLQV